MPVAESLGLAALGWVASPVVTKLLNEGFANLGIDMKERLERLEITILLVFEAAVDKAEGSEHRSKVIKWLQRLKDAHDDAEDELDLLNYRRLERQVIKAARRSIRVRSLFRSHPLPAESVKLLSPRKIKLLRRLNKLEKIANEAEKLRALLAIRPEAGAPDRQTISLLRGEVFGRDEDRKNIVEILKKDSAAAAATTGGGPSSNIPVVAIVGRPGVGKTTLAQDVVKQLRSEVTKHFHPIMWVYASRNFRATDILRQIIQQASISECDDLAISDDGILKKILEYLSRSETASVGSRDNTLKLEELRMEVGQKMNSRKILLVLDDVWCNTEEHNNQWNLLLSCLSEYWSQGSKILITSQTRDAPEKIGAAPENIHQLGELEENYVLELFFHHALPCAEIDPYLREELTEIGKTIAGKLRRDPTAAKIVGRCLQRNLQAAYWRETAQKDWSGDTTKALMWSYQHLPAHLQRCFSYCSLYPQGHKFKALELVQLWMAQGFAEPNDQNERVEDVGKQYLEELVSRFYIQHYPGGRSLLAEDQDLDYYTLHELLFDMAKRVSNGDCLRIEGEYQSNIPSTIRHLSIPASTLNEKKDDVRKLKKLRTLIVAKGESTTSEENVATDIFKSLKKLRVLHSELHLGNLAEFIGKMKHLRILQVSSTSESELPESVCSLYQLQVLRIGGGSSLPKRVNRLVSLRYLEADPDIVCTIPDIGRLTSLQRLAKFKVSKQKEYKLKQLQNLNELRGSLQICNLENVESRESADAANLKEKGHLNMLLLHWDDDDKKYVNSKLDAEILRILPPNLTGLSICGYRGRSYPPQHEDQRSSIETLELKGCHLLGELPPIGQRYPSCRSLVLESLSKLKELPILPPELREIRIQNAPLLTFVTKEDLGMSRADRRSIIEVVRKRSPTIPFVIQRYLDDDERQMKNFVAAMGGSYKDAIYLERASASADMDVTAAGSAYHADVSADKNNWERWLPLHKRKMELIYSRRHEAKLLLPPILTELWLEQCNITNRALSVCLQNLTSLTKLTLRRISTITCLPSEDVLRELKALRYMDITHCWCLTSPGGIKSLLGLKELKLVGCLSLESGTAFMPSSLESATFIGCANVDDILACANLPRLSNLLIRHCHIRSASLQLRDLRSLHSLEIMHCPKLESLVDMQELRCLEHLRLHDCVNLQAVKNLPRSLPSLQIYGCPTLEKRLVKVDPRSGKRTLNGIPVEDSYYSYSISDIRNWFRGSSACSIL